MVRLKIVRKLDAFFHELLHSIVEHDLVKQMTVKVFLFTAFRHIVAAVAQHTELVERHALSILWINGDLPEHLVRHKSVKVRKRGIFITISHEECRNRTGEAAQMVADAALDRILFRIQLFGFYRFDNGFRSLFHRLIAMKFPADVVDHITVALETPCGVLFINSCNLCHCGSGLLCLLDSVITLSNKLMITNGVITVLPVYDGICGFLYFAFQMILGGFFQFTAVLRSCRTHKRVRNRLRELFAKGL